LHELERCVFCRGINMISIKTKEKLNEIRFEIEDTENYIKKLEQTYEVIEALRIKRIKLIQKYTKLEKKAKIESINVVTTGEI